ncbi:MAG: M48 family metallopeptidase [Gemmatimonadota bacterium]|jgi:predicted Zn-dependent protease
MKRVTTPGLAAALAALAALAAALVSGCAVDDRELGAAAAAQIDRQVTIVADPAAQQAMQRFGMALVRASERVTGPTDFAWRFRVVEDTAINAFALPGGYVYVHTALIRQADDAAELGGVIGHEIAHATLRHGALQQEKRQLGTAAITAVCLFTGWCDGGLAQVAVDVGATAVFSKFSRADELQADSAGVFYARAAGLDPRGVTRFFRKLESKRGESPAVLQFLSTHPMESDRIARVEGLLGPGGGATPTAVAPDSMTALFNRLKRSSAPR